MTIIEQRIDVGGISLALTARISSEALAAAFGQPGVAPACEGNPADMTAIDLQPLLVAMQKMLVPGVQSLRESLVEQALVIIQRNVNELLEERRSANAPNA